MMTKWLASFRWAFALAMTLISGFTCPPAIRAQAVTAYEPFSYAAGPVDGQNGGDNWGGAWTTTGTSNNVSATGLTFGALATSGGSISTLGNNNGNFRALTGPMGTPGTSVWVSFLANLNTGTSFANTYNGISLFNGGAEELFMGQAFTSGQYGFQQPGFGQQNSTTNVDNTTHFLVFSFDFGATTATVNFFVDPTPGLTTPDVSAAVANYAAQAFTFDTIRIEGGTGTTASLNFDEIRIGDSYTSVSPVPEPSTLALTGLAAIGWVRFWRKRWTAKAAV